MLCTISGLCLHIDFVPAGHCTVCQTTSQSNHSRKKSVYQTGRLPVTLAGHKVFIFLKVLPPTSLLSGWLCYYALEFCCNKLTAPVSWPDFAQYKLLIQAIILDTTHKVFALTVSRLSRSVLASTLGGVVWISASSWRMAYSCWVLARLTLVFSLSAQSGSATCTAIRSFRCTPRMGNRKPEHSEKRLRYWL